MPELGPICVDYFDLWVGLSPYGTTPADTLT